MTSSLKKIFTIIIATVFSLSCSDKNNSTNNNNLETQMNRIAESYVKIILKVGQHDSDYVDAYYGPEDWRPKGEIIPNDSSAIQMLYDESGSILDSLEGLSKLQANEIETLRYKYLYKQLLAVRTKIFMLAGGKLSFDEESKALYDAVAPEYSEEHFQSIIKELDNELPGDGDVSEQLNNFKKDFIIPKEKLDTVFQTAINECKKRTLQHIDLPPNERFTVEYVTGQPWGGYNWYKGNSYSVIQVNTDLPIFIDRAVDLAAHEGYPGHHVYNLLLEKNLFKGKGWIEFSVYPLFSPQSLIAEGTANYGIEAAFPGDSRIKFEKEVLFPLSGLDSKNADKYYHILLLTEKLNYAENEAARNYLNAKLTREEAKQWLQKYSLMSPERAERYVKFIEKYRSYVINYNLGKDIVKNYIEQNGGTENNIDLRWKLFERLISTPQTPSGLILK